MGDDLAAVVKIYLGLLGSVLSALMGSLARNVYAADGFRWRKVLIDLPFVITVSIVAGGVGEYFELPPLVIYALAGSGSFIGHEFVADMLRQRITGEKNRSGGSNDPATKP